MAHKKACPNGGVNTPIAIFAVQTISKWIRSIPRALAIRATIGARTNTAEAGLRNIPTKIRTIFKTIRNTSVFLSEGKRLTCHIFVLIGAISVLSQALGVLLLHLTELGVQLR